MKKLTLNPETLRVQSFSASTEEREDTGRDAACAEFTRPYLCDPLTVRGC